MLRQRLAFCALVIGIGLLVYSFIPGYGPQETWFQGTNAVLSVPRMTVTQVSINDGTGFKDYPFTASTDDATISVDLTGLKPNAVNALSPNPQWYALQLTYKESATPRVLELQVLSKRLGVIAAAGALLAILAAPEVLIRKTRLVYLSGKRQNAVTGWTYLLMEPGSGLSLARFQLILLFVPAAAVYLTLSFPLHQFPTMPNTVWQLLGLGGASAALSSIITPGQSSATGTQSTSGVPAAVDATAAGLDPAPAAPTAPPADAVAQAVITSLNQQGAAALDLSSDAGRAALTNAFRLAAGTPQSATGAAAAPTDLVTVRAPNGADLFEEANGFGDISRYQSLVMCAATAVTFFVSFFDTWSVPSLPPQVLELLGTSLAVYLGVKGVNQVKKSNATKTAA